VSRLDQSTIEAAAQWFVDLKDLPEQHPQYHQHRLWLEQSDEHQRAWQRVERLQALLAEQDPRSARVLTRARATRRDTLKLLSLFGLGTGTAAVGWQYSPWAGSAADLQTASGEIRHLQLPDGSQLVLNTRTAVDLRYSDSQRELRLHEGELRLTSHPDLQNRPLFVTTPHGRVTALGTEFIVYSSELGARINVLADEVEVSSAGQQQRLTAGQQLLWRQGALDSVSDNPEFIDSWHQGLLVVSDWPLEQLVDSLRRYHKGWINLDPQVAGLRISGAFRLDDLPATLGNIAQTLDLQVQFLTRYWVRIGKS